MPEPFLKMGLRLPKAKKNKEEEKMNRKIFTSLLVIGMALAAIAGGTPGLVHL